MFRKRSIEVIAAIDPKPEPIQMVEKQKVKKAVVQPPITVEPIPSKSVNNQEPKSTHLLKEIADLKGMIADLRTTTQADRQYPELLEQAHTFLIEQDVDATNRVSNYGDVACKVACC